MWDKTKEIIRMIKTALEKNADADDLTVTIVLDKDAAIRLGDELSRFVNGHELRRTIRHMTETAKDPAIRQVTCLYDTVDPMVSKDYKDRFYAEYWQLKIRYEKLKKRNTMTEAYRRAMEAKNYENVIPRGDIKELPHDCPNEMLVAQQRIMEDYLHVLELRAVLEGITLDPEA